MHSSTPPPPKSWNDKHLKDLSTDEVAIIFVFGFLSPYDIMRARVCTSWRDAAKKTIVPLTPCLVSAGLARAMSTALPNLQQLSICGGHKYSDGQDAIEATAAITADDTIHGIGMLSKFTKLRVLEIGDANYLTGSLGDLSPLKNTLEKVCIQKCRNISGNFMELADFPHLKELDLHDTAVTGDIQDICVDDFPVLERLSLPKNVRGGRGYEFQHVNEVPAFMHTIYVLLQRSPTLFKEPWLSTAFDWRLSEDSPDWYADDELAKLMKILPLAPFELRFIQSGSRRGWRWCNSRRNDSCEINWFGPEPSSDEIEEFLRRNVVLYYRGYYQPPTEEEYRRIIGQLMGVMD
eukprot:scaffold1879_cov97-Skeletonema_marinoi.AAC.5